MSKVRMLRALVQQRLTAAAEDILALFERTIAEYEEELSRSKEEIRRQHRLLDAVFNPQVQLNPSDAQQLFVRREVVKPEQSYTLDQEVKEHPSTKQEQEDHEMLPIKEEHNEVWTSQEGEQLQALQEEGIIKFTFTPFHVKSEDDYEAEPQSLQLHHSQTEEIRDSVGRPEPEIEHTTSDSVQTSDILLNDVRYDAEEKPFGCSECGRRFRQKSHLQIHMRGHTGEKPFSCSVCAKRFPRKESLVRHMRFHSGEKPFSCSICKKDFTRRDHAVTHMRIHTGEKPFTCSVCGKRFAHKLSLKHHMSSHTGQRAFSCSVCHRMFNRQCHVRHHKCVFSSSIGEAVTLQQWTDETGTHMHETGTLQKDSEVS